MAKLDRGGCTLYYEEHGAGEPLLCVMGLAADTMAWTLQVPAFAERHRTIIFDNRDVGRSSQVDGAYEIADMAQDRSRWPTRCRWRAFTCSGRRWEGRSPRRSH